MPVRLTIQVALATALGGLVAGLGSVWVALSTYEVSSAVAFRAVLVLAVLLAGPFLLVRRRVLAATRRSLVAAGVTGSPSASRSTPLPGRVAASSPSR